MKTPTHGSRRRSYGGGRVRIDRLDRTIACVSLLAVAGFTTPVLLAQSSDDASKPVNAEVATPSTRAITRTVRLPGSLMANEQVDLYAKASGFVEQVKVDIGSRVRAGDPLVVLTVPEMADEARRAAARVNAKEAAVRALEARTRQAERAVEIARAEVGRYEAEHALAEVNLKRKRELREANAIPEQALDEAQSAMAIGEAQLAIARAEVGGAAALLKSVAADGEVARADAAVALAELQRLETLMGYATVRAPFDGVITMRGVDVGTFVRSAADGSSKPLLTIAMVTKIRLVLDIPEVDVIYVRPGTPLTYHVPALGSSEFDATMTRVAPALDPSTRSMRAEADIDNSGGSLAPGMYANVIVKLETKASAMLVPARAIRQDSGTTAVFVEHDGRAVARAVVLGYDDGIWAEVLEGLSGDERVIVSAGGTVVPGTRIRSISVTKSPS